MSHLVFQLLGQRLQRGFFRVRQAVFGAFRVGHHQIDHLGGGQKVNHPHAAAFSLVARRHSDFAQPTGFLDEIAFVRRLNQRLLQLPEFFIRGDLFYLTGKHRGLDKLNRVTHGCLLCSMAYIVHLILISEKRSHRGAIIAGRLFLRLWLLLTQLLGVGAVVLSNQRIKRLTFLLKLSTCARKLST